MKSAPAGRATVESLARIDALARLGDTLTLTQAERLEWPDP